MIVLYTFDLPDEYSNFQFQHNFDPLLMLKISIYSVIRELSPYLTGICIYSNNKTIIKKKINLDNSLIKYCNLPKNNNKKISDAVVNINYNFDLSVQLNSHYRSINNKIGIAHSRVFLISKLQKKYNQNVLYLDYDTGIMRNSGQRLINKLNSNCIITDMMSANSIAESIHTLYADYNVNTLPKYINPYAIRWCCGYLYIPYNDIGIKIAKRFSYLYLKLLNDLGFMDSHDENAIGIALDELAIYPKLLFKNTNFYSVDSNDLQTNTLPEFPEIVHYSYQKGHSKNKEKLVVWLNEWKKFFNLENDEPKFDYNDYKKMESRDFIWGRFETI